MAKTLAEIIPFTEKDKVIIELLDEKIQLLEDELDKIEEAEFKTGVLDQERKNSLVTAISYVREIRLAILHDYTEKMAKEKFDETLNLITDIFFEKSEEKHKRYEASLGEAITKRNDALLKLYHTTPITDASYNEKKDKIEKEFQERKKEIEFQNRVRDFHIGSKYNKSLKERKNDSKQEIREDRLFLEYIKYIRKDQNNLDYIRVSIKELEDTLRKYLENNSEIDLKLDDSLCPFISYVCAIYGFRSTDNIKENYEIITQIREVIENFASIVMASTEFMYLSNDDINALIDIYNQISNVGAKALKRN